MRYAVKHDGYTCCTTVRMVQCSSRSKVMLLVGKQTQSHVEPLPCDMTIDSSVAAGQHAGIGGHSF